MHSRMEFQNGGVFQTQWEWNFSEWKCIPKWNNYLCGGVPYHQYPVFTAACLLIQLSGVFWHRRHPSRAGGREPSLSTVLFWPVTQYLMNIVIFKWVLANSDEYHLLKWVLITPLSQCVCKIHTWQALSGCEQSTWNTAIWLEPVEFHRQNKTVHTVDFSSLRICVYAPWHPTYVTIEKGRAGN